MGRKNRKGWRWFFGIILGFIILLSGLYARMVQVRKATLAGSLEDKPAPVVVQTIHVTDTWRTVSFMGRVDSGQSIRVHADVGGWVKKRLVERGITVRAGEPILVLEDERKTYREQEARARLTSARARLADLKRKREQADQLVREGIFSQDQLDSLDHQVAAQSATVDALEAAWKQALWNRDHLVIRSPIQGVVVEVLPDLGQEVLPGETVVRLVRADAKRVLAGVDVRWARIVHPGNRVDLISKSNGTVHRGKARIVGISPDMDPVSGTYTIEARITSKDPDWWSGQVVYLLLPVERLKRIVIVPRTAVLSDESGTFVFVYKEGKAIQIPVTVTWLDDRSGAVSAAFLPKGSSLIVGGHTGLANGQSVRILPNATLSDKE